MPFSLMVNAILQIKISIQFLMPQNHNRKSSYGERTGREIDGDVERGKFHTEKGFETERLHIIRQRGS